MKQNTINVINRSISALFTTPTFKDVFRSGESEYITEKMSSFKKQIGAPKGTTIGKAINKAYQYLTENYRNEYIYKNVIANKLLLERHDLKEAGLLNEVRIGSSIADLIVINGTNTIYEIKTELDSPIKLLKQIESYKKVSPKVFLVTHHSLIDKYSPIIAESAVGLISLNENQNLDIIYEPMADTSFFDIKMMMSMLRKDEYSGLIFSHFGYLPNVSNINFYKECLKLAIQITETEFHSLMLVQLRKRIVKEARLLSSKKTPIELKHICFCQNPSKSEFENLYRFLNLSI